VFCTYWNGSQEFLGSLNFPNQSIDAIGAIKQSNMFTVATANGYDPYRNRYYVLSNLGLVALDASTGGRVAFHPDFSISKCKHVSYISVSDQFYLTLFNGSGGRVLLLLPETFFSIQGQESIN
jgi:hypothetical protein